MSFHAWVTWMSALYRVQPVMFWALHPNALATLLGRQRASIMGLPC